MKLSIYIKRFVIIMVCCCMVSCESFVEVDAPDHKIVSEAVFDDDAMAISVMTGIYNQLFRAFFSSGGSDSVTALAGLSADNLRCIRTTDPTRLEFEQNEILPNNPRNLNVWTSAYNIIYMTNSLLEGLTNSGKITEEIRNQLEGEAKFVRAFTYFYLVNLYGGVPLVLTTDYRVNALAVRDTEEEVYQQIIEDLEDAMDKLEENYINGERTQVNTFVVMALLARVNLYQQNWEEAERLSTQVISQAGTYEILEDPDQVFLANSHEAIWQLSPVGRGSASTNTNEGSIFIINPRITALSHLKLSDDIVGTFQSPDKRLSHWVGFHEGLAVHYAYKYKIRNSTADITEYSMVLRLAEQYLIRAEARAMQGKLKEAIADLDVIRNRANLDLISDINPGIDQEALLEKIMEERRKEFFTEWGHRWLDLKRTGTASEVLGTGHPLWQDTDIRYPIPEEERIKNPNLGQNNGY
ncbi:RagB/SusD family nutrient uptake outer membrane protein [Sinomicrobium pectinilyticum]|uniref:RagB/SusD family nutrient uptake outer membrane protein n=1 Tax=Sinomicrobium pectinilyticum TaxID=1084421 RepID=A0A3N0E7E7_SINP1|nr:RagB/SusD family nutrient uptake outer membrane protein [Sinomicrobium pectinilyticum]RNL83766.1 RagB/SusD family nutrient uptake outer membrane protein [Sinomicrobium pectinilyticum]